MTKEWDGHEDRTGKLNRRTDKEGKKHRDYILTMVIRCRCETRHRWEQSGHKITERQTQEIKRDTTHWGKNTE